MILAMLVHVDPMLLTMDLFANAIQGWFEIQKQGCAHRVHPRALVVFLIMSVSFVRKAIWPTGQNAMVIPELSVFRNARQVLQRYQVPAIGKTT